jgi:hypothetical protein
MTGTVELGPPLSRGNRRCAAVRGRACVTMRRTPVAYRLVRGAIRLPLQLAYRRVEVVGPSASPLSLVDPMLTLGTVPRRLTVLVVGDR